MHVRAVRFPTIWVQTLLFMMRSIRLLPQYFTGYDHLDGESEVTVLTTEKKITDSLMEGQNGTIFVEEDTVLRYHGWPGR